MAYQSLYRKYRSQTFEEVSGQDHVTRTLQNAVRSGRVAHAYLFCGPRGTGKTSTARLLGKALNCEQGPSAEPCNTCAACVQISEGRFLDMTEIDAATNRGIDEIRALRDNVAYAPSGRYKVYVIDEAHQITGEAFNAFLKTLEEPPPHVVFILATTEAHKIPATIVSRCQKFDFRRASLEDLRERVAFVAASEGAEIEPAALELIAREANGGWRDALSLLEQALAFCDGPVTARDIYAVLGTVEADALFELAQGVLSADGAEVFRMLDELIAAGKDPRQLLRDLTTHYRGLMLVAAGCPAVGDPEEAQRASSQARAYGHRRLMAAIEVLAHAEREARWSEQPRLLVELALVRLMYPRETAPPAPSPAGARRPETTPPPVQRHPVPPAKPAAAPHASTASASAPRVDPPESVMEPKETPPRTVGDARAGDTGGEDEDLLAAFDGVTQVTRSPNAPAATEPAAGKARAAATDASHDTARSPDDPSGDIELIKKKWRLVGEELKRDRKVHIQMFLVDTEPDRFERDTLVIRFSTATMAQGFEQRGKDFTGPVLEAIQRVTGITCRLRAEAGTAGKPPARSDDRSGASPAAGGRPKAASRPSPAASAGETPTETVRLPLDSPDECPAAVASPPAPDPAPPTSGAGGTELVHNIIEVFDGRVVEDPDR